MDEEDFKEFVLSVANENLRELMESYLELDGTGSKFFVVIEGIDIRYIEMFQDLDFVNFHSQTTIPTNDISCYIKIKRMDVADCPLSFELRINNMFDNELDDLMKVREMEDYSHEQLRDDLIDFHNHCLILLG